MNETLQRENNKDQESGSPMLTAGILFVQGKIRGEYRDTKGGLSQTLYLQYSAIRLIITICKYTVP